MEYSVPDSRRPAEACLTPGPVCLSDSSVYQRWKKNTGRLVSQTECIRLGVGVGWGGVWAGKLVGQAVSLTDRRRPTEKKDDKERVCQTQEVLA